MKSRRPYLFLCGPVLLELRDVEDLRYNTKRPHMSFDLDAIETPYQAYLGRMPGREGIVEDEEAGEIPCPEEEGRGELIRDSTPNAYMTSPYGLI